MPDALERRYRRLLRAYPRAYRKQRGDEMLATLLQSADDVGNGSITEGLHVIMSGLRVRLRPAGGMRTAVPVALAALLGFVVGASVASWLAWQTAPALLADGRAFASVAQTAFPDFPAHLLTEGTSEKSDADLPRTPLSAGEDVVRISAPFGFEHFASLGPRSRQHRFLEFVLGGDDYDTESVHVIYHPSEPKGTLTTAVRRLRAAGWSTDGVEDSASSTHAHLRRGDIVAELTFDTVDPLSATYGGTRTGAAYREISLHAERLHDPALVLPATAAGSVVGLLMGWLLAASVSRRLVRQGGATRAATNALAVVAGVGFAPVVLATLPGLGYYFVASDSNQPVWAMWTFILFRPEAVVGAAALAAVLGLSWLSPVSYATSALRGRTSATLTS